MTEDEFLKVYTDIPNGVENIDLSQCADGNASVGSKVADITTKALTHSEEIYCIDGTKINPPKFAFSSDMNRTLQHN